MKGIAGGELYRQFRIVRKVGFIIKTKRSQAGFVEGMSYGVSRQREPVHFERAVRLLVNIKMTFIPTRSKVFCLYGRLVERMRLPSAN